MPTLLSCIGKQERAPEFGVIGLNAPHRTGRQGCAERDWHFRKESERKPFHAVIDPNADYWRAVDEAIRRAREPERQPLPPPPPPATIERATSSGNGKRGILRITLTCVAVTTAKTLSHYTASWTERRLVRARLKDCFHFNQG